MSGESVRDGCVRCGRPVATDDLRVGISFRPAEVVSLIKSTTDMKLQDRLLCALGTVDPDLERSTRAELLNTASGCPSCPVLEQRLGAAEETIDELQGIIDDLENSAVAR